MYDISRRRLEGWLRKDGKLEPIPNMQGWISPRLGVRFETANGQLVLYRPNGQRFLSPAESRQKARQEHTDLERLRAKLRQMNIDPDSF